jgi:type VI secretion system secreted protein VgrG
MATLTQENRLLNFITPLGADVLIIRSIEGTEGISQLFNFRVDCFAANERDIDFSKLIGQPIAVRVALRGETTGNAFRHYHGAVQTVSRGARGNTNTAYTIHAVPWFWMLTRTTQSRIFQQKTVPDILKDVLKGFDVAWEIMGNFEPRDYCVQYRESDYDFACRLMEEEGIFYYFRHKEDGHQMVVANSSQTHKDQTHVSTLYYDAERGGMEDVDIIYAWEKSQTLRSGKTTLWDQCFELPHKNLQAQALIEDQVMIGSKSHKLKVAGNDRMELYDFPGGYAQRFDGVNTGGGEQSGNLQKIFQDNERTVKIRMQQEAVNSILLTAYTGCLAISSGFRFKLERHYEDNDTYLITRANFSIPQAGGYSAGSDLDAPPPEIVFNCIPYSLPFRPQRLVPKPVIHSTQTAVVVGPPGEELFTDKYGRIKVAFLWDRECKWDGTSSCWIRVGMLSAGKNWGMMAIPRVGHEVIVAFEEGDPDRPIVVGTVYNADMMPGYGMPDSKTMMSFKSRSTPGGGGYNEIRYEDKKDKEQFFMHAQKDMDLRVLNDYREWIGRDTHSIVKRDQFENVERDYHRKISRNLIEEIAVDHMRKITGKDAVEIGGSSSLTVGGSLAQKVGGDMSLVVDGNLYIKATGALVIESSQQVSCKVGGNFVDIGMSGVTIVGTMVNINSGGSAGSGSKKDKNPLQPPTKAKEADKHEAGGHKAYSGSYSGQRYVPGKGQKFPPPPPGPSYTPDKPENKDKKHWVGVRLKDNTGKPMAGQICHIVLPSGEVWEGTLDEKGEAKVEQLDPGNCTISFPGLSDWKKG